MMSSETVDQRQGSSFFSSPEEAIPIITELLEKKNFKTLASYYDLGKSDIDYAELGSGDFFIRKERPEAVHPAGFWRFKHPFAPGFKYSHKSQSSREDVYIIHLRMEIDQGAGSPAQIGEDTFYMIRSDGGWQILPGDVEEKAAEIPMAAPEPMPDPSWK